MSRSIRVLVLIAIFAAALGVSFGTVLWLFPVGKSLVTQPSTVGGPFRLVDQDGVTVTEQDFKGKPFLVFFGFTHCPDVCPAALFEVSEILRAMDKDGDKVGALFITVDPERDTPEKMKDYLQSFDPRLRGLSGSTEDLEKVAKAYRVYYKKVPLADNDYTMDHTALVYLMDKDGRFVAPFNIKRPPEQAAADMRRYL